MVSACVGELGEAGRPAVGTEPARPVELVDAVGDDEDVERVAAPVTDERERRTGPAGHAAVLARRASTHASTSPTRNRCVRTDKT